MSNLTLAAALFASWITYVVLMGIYRVFYSPLGRFPGPRMTGRPKLTRIIHYVNSLTFHHGCDLWWDNILIDSTPPALTMWYQGYYDIWLPGQYFRKINEMHLKYGPIVRISPRELHVDDPEFIDELFTGPGKRRDKDMLIGRSVQVWDSTLGTISHDLHRKRRASFSPYFSKASIRRLEPRITESLDNLLRRLDASAKSGEVVPMGNVYRALASDVITAYCFGESSGFLLQDDYNAPLFDAVYEFFKLSWWNTHVGWFGPLMNSIPQQAQLMLMPGLKSFFSMKHGWLDQIEEARSSKSSDEKKETVFHGILNSDLPDAEKSNHRLQQEAQLLVQGGQDTTASTLSSITFELLANPPILKKLRDELAAAFPNAGTHPTSAQLEQLPYLTAVIQEGLRLHPGTIIRMQRVSPDESLFYRDPSTKKEWTIPAGTSVSMDALSISMNATIFPEPRKYLPERWIGNKGLEKYLLAFSKGTRMCAGINLAYAELYTVIGGIFRKYDVYDSAIKQNTPTLALYETTREQDVDVEYDYLIPFPKSENRGIRTIVR